jgi:hypothetical protein
VGGSRTLGPKGVPVTGATIDFLLSAKRDTVAAKRFLAKALGGANHPPRVINTDKDATLPASHRVPLEVDTGGIIGVVDVIDCVERHTSKWFEKGNFGWVLTNPRRLNFRPCKGALRLFRPKY